MYSYATSAEGRLGLIIAGSIAAVLLLFWAYRQGNRRGQAASDASSHSASPENPGAHSRSHGTGWQRDASHDR